MSLIDKSDVQDLYQGTRVVIKTVKPLYRVVETSVRKLFEVKGIYGNARGMRDGARSIRRETDIAHRALRENELPLCTLSASQVAKQGCVVLLSGVSAFYGVAGLLQFKGLVKPPFYRPGNLLKQLLQQVRTLYQMGRGGSLLAGLESLNGPKEKLLWWKGELGIGESKVKEERVALASSDAVVKKVKGLLAYLSALEEGDLEAEEKVAEGLKEVESLVRQELFFRRVDFGLLANILVKEMLSTAFPQLKPVMTVLSVGGTVVGAGRWIYKSRLVDSVLERFRVGSP